MSQEYEVSYIGSTIVTNGQECYAQSAGGGAVLASPLNSSATEVAKLRIDEALSVIVAMSHSVGLAER